MSQPTEINLTIFHPPTGRTDAISLSPSTTTILDFANFATALLGLDDANSGVVLTKDSSTMPLYHATATAEADKNKTLEQCGLKNGDFVSVFRVSEVRSATRRPQQQRQPQPASQTQQSRVGGGGLDFSSLLGSQPSASSTSSNTSSSNGLTFNIPGLIASASTSNPWGNPNAAPQPVEWDGMNLDDAIQRNPNPVHLMTVLTNSTRHPNLLKELNYHNPAVYKRLMLANNDIPKMATIWRETMMKSATARFLQRHTEQSKESEMTKRLRLNPMDEEANKYFGEKIRLENVHRQYEQMMEEYPESMGRVLMLYINCLVNEKPLQVFVDSGAQMTIMSSACADRLGLLHLVDNRFAGTAVGVGTGKIMGKIHIVDLTIGGYAFPCSITVMDSESGLGDKNMDCLFGLDMLKRHRCSIDLAKNALVFPLSSGQVLEEPFLHEKDLPVSKGGTMGFDAEKENAELEAVLEKMDNENSEKSGDSGDDKGGKSSDDNMDESK